MFRHVRRVVNAVPRTPRPHKRGNHRLPSIGRHVTTQYSTRPGETPRESAACGALSDTMKSVLDPSRAIFPITDESLRPGGAPRIVAAHAAFGCAAADSG